jgi:hypothetical protein
MNVKLKHMNEQEIKKELVKQIELDLTIKGEILKSQDLITDYDVKTDVENISVAEDGVLEYDVVITQKIIPKRSLENVVIDFKISPSSEF